MHIFTGSWSQKTTTETLQKEENNSQYVNSNSQPQCCYLNALKFTTLQIKYGISENNIRLKNLMTGEDTIFSRLIFEIDCPLFVQLILFQSSFKNK